MTVWVFYFIFFIFSLIDLCLYLLQGLQTFLISELHTFCHRGCRHPGISMVLLHQEEPERLRNSVPDEASGLLFVTTQSVVYFILFFLIQCWVPEGDDLQFSSHIYFCFRFCLK